MAGIIVHTPLLSRPPPGGGRLAGACSGLPRPHVAAQAGGQQLKYGILRLLAVGEDAFYHISGVHHR